MIETFKPKVEAGDPNLKLSTINPLEAAIKQQKARNNLDSLTTKAKELNRKIRLQTYVTGRQAITDLGRLTQNVNAANRQMDRNILASEMVSKTRIKNNFERLSSGATQQPRPAELFGGTRSRAVFRNPSPGNEELQQKLKQVHNKIYSATRKDVAKQTNIFPQELEALEIDRKELQRQINELRLVSAAPTLGRTPGVAAPTLGPNDGAAT